MNDEGKKLKIKVCGTREAENIHAIQSLGVEMIGMIFYEKSPRYVASNVAIRSVLARSASMESKRSALIGVFVNAPIETIVATIIAYSLDGVQLHGQEDLTYIAALKETIAPRIKIFKAVGIDETFNFETLSLFEPSNNKPAPWIDLFVFDTKTPQHGGSGVKFDWSILDNYKGTIPFLLSGGISAEDAEAIKQLNTKQLYGVDLNSKFEITPALKDIEKLRRFVETLQK